mmetsp:Transcript_29842/g.86655  ORF Transcript_29842/g.86655 Transcript_29842/m.86655 type:complete len:264 (+) Transcript_29842:145-936(+)
MEAHALGDTEARLEKALEMYQLFGREFSEDSEAHAQASPKELQGDLSRQTSVEMFHNDEVEKAGLLPKQREDLTGRRPTVRNLIDFTVCNSPHGDTASTATSSAIPSADELRRRSTSHVRVAAAEVLAARERRHLRRVAFHAWHAAQSSAPAAAVADCGPRHDGSRRSPPRPLVRRGTTPLLPWLGAAAWQGILALWTWSLVAGGMPRLALSSLPFWLVGVRMLGIGGGGNSIAAERSATEDRRGDELNARHRPTEEGTSVET